MTRILFVFIMTCALHSTAQTKRQPLEHRGIGLEFSSHYIGRNINLTYRHQLHRVWAAYGGVKYHMNGPDMPDNKGLFFYKRFHAESAAQRYGLKLGIERVIYRNSHAEIYAFYDFQFSKSTLRKGAYYYAGTDSLGGVLYSYDLFIFSPIKTFENQLGIGARVRCSDRIFLKGSIAGGAMLIQYPQFDYKHNTQIVGSGRDYEFTRMYSVGLEYRIR